MMAYLAEGRLQEWMQVEQSELPLDFLQHATHQIRQELAQASEVLIGLIKPAQGC